MSRSLSCAALALALPLSAQEQAAPDLDASLAARSLPFASSLCGSCNEVCPVGIDLHRQLLAWRARIHDARLQGATKRLFALLWVRSRINHVRCVFACSNALRIMGTLC